MAHALDQLFSGHHGLRVHSSRVPVSRSQTGPRAEDGIRTRDPHLGKVWVFVHPVVASPMASDSVHPFSSPSTQSDAVVERSTIRRAQRAMPQSQLARKEPRRGVDKRRTLANESGMKFLAVGRVLAPQRCLRRRLHEMLTAWRVEALVNYFQMVAVEVCDVGCVIARSEIHSYRRLALARSASLNRCSVRGVDLGLIVSNKPYVESGFTRLTLA